MDFRDLQEAIIKNAARYGKEFNVDIDKDFSFRKLIEEVGEFAEALLTLENKSRADKLLPPEQAKEKVAQELADIVGMAIVNAQVLRIDLEEALKQKWTKPSESRSDS